MEKSKKIQLNFLTGVLSEILTLAFGVLMPRLTLTNYGSEINGLVTSVTQIYAYVALTEAGVGGATLQALYNTVGHDDKDGTNSILAATNHFYRRTGIAYLAAIILFSVFYPVFVESEVSTLTTVLVIVFLGLGNVISYFFQAKYSLFLQADGKNYTITTLNMITNIFKNVGKLVLMLLGVNVIFVQLLGTIASLIQMIVILAYIRRNYAWINVSAKPNFVAISQSKNVLIHQMSGLIFNNTDILLLTIFFGLKLVSVYSLYAMIFTTLATFAGLFVSSVKFSFGQRYHIDRDAFVRDYDSIETIFWGIIFCFVTVATIFVLPFLRVYTAGVEDINYIDKYLPFMFAANTLLNNIRTVANNTINIAGHFKQTQWRSIFESVINLTVSLVLVRRLGIYGVLLGTTAAMLYRTNDMLIYTNHHILNRSAWRSYRRLFADIALFVVIVVLSKQLTWEMNGYIDMILYAIPCTLVCGGLYLGVAYLVDRESIKYLVRYIRTKLLTRG